MTNPPNEDRETEKQLRPDWREFAGILIAVYQLLIPKLLAVILGVTITTYLLLWLWR